MSFWGIRKVKLLWIWTGIHFVTFTNGLFCVCIPSWQLPVQIKQPRHWSLAWNMFICSCSYNSTLSGKVKYCLEDCMIHLFAKNKFWFNNVEQTFLLGMKTFLKEDQGWEWKPIFTHFLYNFNPLNSKLLSKCRDSVAKQSFVEQPQVF